jgi:hypothetical protein
LKARRVKGLDPDAALADNLQRIVATRLDEMCSFVPRALDPARMKALHDMRIAAKRLRYIMQALAPLYPDELAEPIQAAHLCQTRLGDIHDGDVWIDTLPHFLEEEQARTLAYFGSTTPFEPLKPGILALHHNRQQQRAQDYQEFVTFWEQLQAQGVWERLRQTLAAPRAAAEAAPEIAVPHASDAPTREAVAEVSAEKETVYDNPVVFQKWRW